MGQLVTLYFKVVYGIPLRLMRFGWYKADLVFQPRYRLAEPDEVVDKLGTARTWISWGITVAVVMAYDDASTNRDDLVGRALTKFASTVLIGLIACLLAMGVLLWLTQPVHRRFSAQQMWWPLKSIGIGLAAVIITGAAGSLAGLVADHLDSTTRGDTWVVAGIALVVGMAAIGLAGIGFCVRMMFLVTKHWFNAVDGHLLLGPTVSVVVAWATVFLDIGVLDALALPRYVDLVVTLGGAITVTALAVEEGRRANRNHGVTFRTGSRPPLYSRS